MSEMTPRLRAPYIRASQAQKEVTHNTALNVLDALVQTVVIDRDLAVPPLTPAEGGIWIVAGSASGAWAGHEGEIAQYIGGTWVFYEPFEGQSVWLLDEHMAARYGSGLWIAGQVHGTALYIGGAPVVGPRQAAIADASGGAVIDAEARAALNLLLSACRNHGLIDA